MNEIPQFENIEQSIEALLAQEIILYEQYAELYGEPDEKLADREWGVSMEAKIGKNRQLAKTHLEELIEFLENQIAKKV